MPLRGDRIHRYVNAFCPLCHEEQPDRPLAEVRRLSGWLVEREERIWLERGLPRPRPGPHAVRRVAGDPHLPRAVDRADQGAHPRRRRQLQSRAGGLRHGLPEMQTQHTCILLQDLLDHCNLKCPTCFAASAPALASVVPLEQVLASIDARLSRENGRIDVLMLSGGEPTLYPQLAELLDEVAARPVVRVLVNTNGLAIAQDDELLELLTRHRERVEVYLQYDGAVGRGLDPPPGRRHPAVQGAGDRAALRGRGVHHADDDRRARRQRRRDRLRAQAGAGHAVRRRGHDPAGVRLRTQRRARPDGPAHPHRRARAARGADRRPGDVARPDRAAVLAPALLLGRLPAARRLRGRGGRWSR